MSTVVTFGILVLPAIASTITCIAAWLLSLAFPEHVAQGGLRLEFLWWSALFFAIPATLIGMAIFAPLARTFRDAGTVYISLSSGAGAILGLLSFVAVWLILNSVWMGSPSSKPDAAFAMLSASIAFAGLVSGAIFGFVANLTVRSEQR